MTIENPTNFQLVSTMNEAFNNPKGDPLNFSPVKIFNQTKNIGHELAETMKALGATEESVKALIEATDNLKLDPNARIDLEQVRDGLTDIHVFAYGAHHLMGIDADKDMISVIYGVMSRFVKDEEDLIETKAKHAAKGVTETYTEGMFPVMILKSAVDQPDAPKGKFLKAASYHEPIFYSVG